MSYLSEFHASAYRSRVQLIRGVASGVGNIVLPMLGWAILPKTIEIFIGDSICKIVTCNYYAVVIHHCLISDLHSWHLFILSCGVPALTTAVAFIFMPESPKFLMAAGRTKEALAVFERVYRINTGKDTSTFAVKSNLHFFI